MKKLFFVLIIPALIIFVSLSAANYIIERKPEAKTRPPRNKISVVEAIAVQKTVFPVWLKTRGTIEASTNSTLIPQVQGMVTSVSPNFEDGGFFERGEVLLQIDPRDYNSAVLISEANFLKTQMDYENVKGQKINYAAALRIAQSELSEAKLKFQEEQARSELALTNWKELDKKGDPGALVLRKPQLLSAKARVQAIEAKVMQTKNEITLFDVRLKASEAQVMAAETTLGQKKVDLERTKITAPFAGRIWQKKVDIGQYVSPGTILANIYASEFVEIRLPLRDDQLQMVNLPERFRGNLRAGEGNPQVKIVSESGSTKSEWTGRIVRTEGVVDPQSQQVFVVARVDNPFQLKKEKHSSLKIGRFVEAHIEGVILNDIFIIPRSALRGGDAVLIVDKENFLSLRKVSVLWKQDDQVVIDMDMASDDRLCITPIMYGEASKPFKVRVKGDEPKKKKKREA